MSVSMIAAGATLAVNKTAKADETNGTVIAASELSKDIRAVYDAFDVNPLISGNSTQSDYYDTFKKAYKVEYVQNATINGQTVSGLRFTIDTNLSGKRVTVIQPSSLKIDTSALSWDTSMFGFMMESRENKTGVGFELGPTLIDEDGQGFRLQLYESDIPNSERSAIRAYVVNGASNNTVATDVNSGAGGTDVGGYYGANYVYSPSVRKWVGNTYVDTFAESATAPFNFYYDNATNVAYCDASGDGSNMGWHLIRMFSEDPANYAAHVSPFPSEAGKSYGTGTGEATKFLGFKNNSARLGIRLIHGAGIGKYSFILTSYAGLDLTNPQNTVAAEKATLQLKDFGVQTNGYKTVAGEEAKLPEAHFANAITHEYVEDFVGQVKVYKARRSSGMEYTAWGATVTADELGEAVATVSYGENYTFANAGDYTLEYVSDSGDKLYVDVNAIENVDKTVNFSGLNATVDKTVAKIGDEITITPSAGYTLYGFGSGAPRAKITIGTTVKYVDLVDGKFTVTFDMIDGENLNVEAAAYSKAINLTIFTKPFDEGNDSVPYTLYEGIPSTYYDGANDGTVTVSGFKFTYGLVGDDWKMNLVNELGNFGYAVEINDGETVSKYVYKTGVVASNAFAVTGSVIITPIRLSVTAVENSAKAYLKGGNINVSMEYKVPVVQWDYFIDAVGNGASQIDVKGVFDKGEKPTGRPYNYANGVTFKVDLQKVTEREIDGTNYYIIRLECANLKIENVKQKYYFGISLLLNCGNGGQVLVNDPSGAFLWTEVDMKTEVEKLYAKYIKTTAPEDHHTTVTVSGTEYYSYITEASTVKLVEYHLMTLSA